MPLNAGAFFVNRGSHYELRYKTIDNDINPFLFFALAEQYVGLDGFARS